MRRGRRFISWLEDEDLQESLDSEHLYIDHPLTTVTRNLENLATWLHAQGYASRDSLIVGDRAMLNAEIAVLYDAYYSAA